MISECSLHPVTPRNPKYKTGFVLSGGGARGFAHLGAIQALKEKGIFPDIISGVSAGALAGIFIADGYEPYDIMEIFDKLTFKEFTQLSIPHTGLFKTTRIQSFLENHIRARKFEDLKIPLIVTASDFDRGKSVHFYTGSALEPVVASCSFPIVFSPTEINGIRYVDGGLFMNFPVSVLREDCEQIIGINVSPVATQECKDNLKGVVEKCFQYMLEATAYHHTPLCDILIKPVEVRKYSMFDVKAAKKIFEIGYNATQEVLEESSRKKLPATE